MNWFKKAHLYFYFLASTLALLLNIIFAMVVKSLITVGSVSYYIPTIVFGILSLALFAYSIYNFWHIFKNMKYFSKPTIIKEILCGVFYFLFFVFSIITPIIISNSNLHTLDGNGNIQIKEELLISLLFIGASLFLVTNFFYISFISSAMQEEGIGNDGVKHLIRNDNKDKKDNILKRRLGLKSKKKTDAERLKEAKEASKKEKKE